MFSVSRLLCAGYFDTTVNDLSLHCYVDLYTVFWWNQHYCTWNIIWNKEVFPMLWQARLVDSNGYAYTWRPLNKENVTYWRCAVRNKTVYCKATVTQRGELFRRGPVKHVCTAEPGLRSDNLLIVAEILWTCCPDLPASFRGNCGHYPCGIINYHTLGF